MSLKLLVRRLALTVTPTGILALPLALTSVVVTPVFGNTPAPAGWAESVNGKARILTKGPARIEIGGWTDPGGQSLDQWLQTFERTAPPGGTFAASVAVKPGGGGSFYMTRTIKFGRVSAVSVLHACAGAQGLGRLTEFHMRKEDKKLFKRGASFIKESCKNESPNAVVANTPVSSETVAPVKRAALAAGNTPQGLKEIRGVQVFGIQPGGLFGVTEEFIATFNDGTYTTDFATTFNDGVAESKGRKPEAWGRWREREGKLELAQKRSDEFESSSGNWIVDPGAAGEYLSQCFTRHSSAGGVGPLVGGSRTWCFTTDGRFASSSAVYAIANTSAGGVTYGSESPKTQGRYLIDGYTIRFVFDDGQQQTAAFAFASDKKHHIVINGLRFIGKEP